MSTSLWVNGDLVPAAEARISALDAGFRSGLGVFETLRVDHGRAFRLSAHLARLAAGARALGFELRTGALSRGVAATVTANSHLGVHLALRITCSPGPLDPHGPFPGVPSGRATMVITVQPTPPPSPAPEAATARSTDLRREVAGTKHTSYLVSLLAQQAAAAAGCTDGLLTTPSGAPLEAATANLFVVVDGAVLTPPPGAGILPGITRGAVLELARTAGVAVEERHLTGAQLTGADEAFLTSAVRGVRALTAVDGRAIGGGAPGPVTSQLATAHRTLVEGEAEPVVVSRSAGG